MADQKITIEVEGNHSFEVEPTGDRDPLSEAMSLFGGTCVVERRKDGTFTVHPIERITAVHVGDVPSRRVGFPTVPAD